MAQWLQVLKVYHLEVSWEVFEPHLHSVEVVFGVLEVVLVGFFEVVLKEHPHWLEAVDYWLQMNQRLVVGMVVYSDWFEVVYTYFDWCLVVHMGVYFGVFHWRL